MTVGTFFVIILIEVLVLSLVVSFDASVFLLIFNSSFAFFFPQYHRCNLTRDFKLILQVFVTSLRHVYRGTR